MRLLASLQPPPAIPGPAKNDSLALADLLLDHAEAIPLDPLVEALLDLVFERMRGRAQSRLARECYFLDPDRVALDAVTRLYSSTLFGERVKPATDFMDFTLGRAIHHGLMNPEMLLFHATPGSPENVRLAAHMAHIANHSELPLRQACWKLWLDRKNLKTVARETGIPLERLELLVTHLVTRGMELAAGQPFMGDSTASEGRPEPGDEEEPEAEREEGADD